MKNKQLQSIISQKTQKTSLEESPTDHNMETLIHSQPMDSKLNETTETDFNSTLLDDGTLSSSHTVNTPSLIDYTKIKNTNQNNNGNSNEYTDKNTNSY